MPRTRHLSVLDLALIERTAGVRANSVDRVERPAHIEDGHRNPAAVQAARRPRRRRGVSRETELAGLRRRSGRCRSIGRTRRWRHVSLGDRHRNDTRTAGCPDVRRSPLLRVVRRHPAGPLLGNQSFRTDPGGYEPHPNEEPGRTGNPQRTALRRCDGGHGPRRDPTEVRHGAARTVSRHHPAAARRVRQVSGGAARTSRGVLRDCRSHSVTVNFFGGVGNMSSRVTRFCCTS